MIHYSCDRCGKLIDPQVEIRYVLRVEVQAAIESHDTDINERDHLDELQEIIERLKDTDHEELGRDLYHQSRHDLCSACQREYLMNPTAKETQLQFGFSEN